MSSVLFDPSLRIPELTPALKKEARAQTVYSLLPLQNDALRLRVLSRNVRLQAEHMELHTLLSEAQIPYVILKGWASARYYPEALCRTLGDVDFLLRERDFPKVTELLQDQGFTAKKDDGSTHVAFSRPGGSHWEMHRRPNGSVEATDPFFSTLLEEARFEDGMMLPSDFHHCLVLLCHTASHLTKEGLGLRHICDWAVFVEQVDVSQWERQLKDCGLWRFAKILSLLCAEYLHLPYQPWFGTDESAVLPTLMEDIFAAGNFGRKDADRYRQIKYVANSEHRIEKSSTIRQGWEALKRKAEVQQKSRASVLADYAGMLLRGERRADNVKTLSEAKKRRALYRELGLFEREP